jgi:hypothetical protein
VHGFVSIVNVNHNGAALFGDDHVLAGLSDVYERDVVNFAQLVERCANGRHPRLQFG